MRSKTQRCNKNDMSYIYHFKAFCNHKSNKSHHIKKYSMTFKMFLSLEHGLYPIFKLWKDIYLRKQFNDNRLIHYILGYVAKIEWSVYVGNEFVLFRISSRLRLQSFQIPFLSLYCLYLFIRHENELL